MPVSLRQLEIFSAVVVTGSITRAAERIGLSQPSISQQLAKLEKTLGVQLIERHRSGEVVLTAAGEFWHRSGSDLLRRLDKVMADHAARFAEQGVVLRLGATPTLRGRFIAAAARIALQEAGFVRFEIFWALTSAELVERLNMHQLNCVIVDAAALGEEASGYAVAPMFRDRIAWVVPRSIPLPDLRKALRAPEEKLPASRAALTRYVTIGPGLPMQAATDRWYRHNLPQAMPVFSTMTYASAVDFVAEDLATAHCPMSLLPNLPAGTMQKLRWFVIEGRARDVVLAMPKHLITLPSYARIHSRLQEFAHSDYASDMTAPSVASIASLR